MLGKPHEPTNAVPDLTKESTGAFRSQRGTHYISGITYGSYLEIEFTLSAMSNARTISKEKMLGLALQCVSADMKAGWRKSAKDVLENNGLTVTASYKVVGCQGGKTPYLGSMDVIKASVSTQRPFACDTRSGSLAAVGRNCSQAAA